MSQDQSKNVARIKDQLIASHRDWPRNEWGRADYYARYLEILLARAVGAREILLASANVQKWPDRKDVARFQAALFTEKLIISGEIAIPSVKAGEQLPYPRWGDVSVIPRSAVKAVTLLEVENFGESSEEDEFDSVGFTVLLDGHDPVVVNQPIWDRRGDGAHSRTLDALIDGLSGQRP